MAVGRPNSSSGVRFWSMGLLIGSAADACFSAAASAIAKPTAAHLLRQSVTALGSHHSTGYDPCARSEHNGLERHGRAAHCRGDMFQKRGRIMDNWVRFCSGSVAPGARRDRERRPPIGALGDNQGAAGCGCVRIHAKRRDGSLDSDPPRFQIGGSDGPRGGSSALMSKRHLRHLFSSLGCGEG